MTRGNDIQRITVENRSPSLLLQKPRKIMGTQKNHVTLLLYCGEAWSPKLREEGKDSPGEHLYLTAVAPLLISYPPPHM
jgi:hypothetical protein